MPENHVDLGPIERAIGSLEGTVKSLAETTSSGFAGVNARLDGVNGRVRAVENAAATHVTVKNCEKIRDACELARGSTTRLLWIPLALIVVSGIVGVLIAKIF